MGYGHLRAAAPLAEGLKTAILHADRAPIAEDRERRQWASARRFYEVISRLSQLPLIGASLDALLDAVTSIPRLHPFRDLSSPTMGVRSLDRLIRGGLGRGLVEHLRRTETSLLTTFYAPAIAAERLGCERIHCVVTDSDINRIWAPLDSRNSRIRYFVPSRRAFRRLCAYGVPEENIEFTGFPPPHELLGGPELSVLRDNLARRLVRLDPQGIFRDLYRNELEHFLRPLPRDQERRPPLLVYAVGGAGSQVGIARRMLPSFKRSLQEGRIRLTLVAGIRKEVAASLLRAVERAGLSAQLGRGLDVLVAAAKRSRAQHLFAIGASPVPMLSTVLRW